MKGSAPMSIFDEATMVEPLGGGRFAATVHPGWSAPRGPNGGYLAALMLRAMQAVVSDPARRPRSLTLHYLRPPAEAPAEIAVVVEREGRNMTTVSARMVQDHKLCLLGLAALSADFPGQPAWTTPAPDVPAFEDVEPWPLHPRHPPISQRFELRHAIGPQPFSSGGEALAGGWLAFRAPDDARPVDALAIAAMTDAWLPAPWARLDRPVGAPTIDLTIHFRAPELVLPPGEPVLVRFATRTAHGGFSEEDGEVWSRDGVLLAQSRQLALLMDDV